VTVKWPPPASQVVADAREAVEFDGIHFTAWLPPRERSEHLRLAAAVKLAPTIEAAEALLCGVDVPVHRLDRGWVDALGLEGTALLDPELALRVSGYGPLNTSAESRRRPCKGTPRSGRS
jgi:hypothetical protein